MAVDRTAPASVTAFADVPSFARGYVRDLRVRWALEEAATDYRPHLLGLDEAKQPANLRQQPFGQVPAYADGKVAMFESGAIVLYIGERCETLLPHAADQRALAVSWVFAALNSVEPSLQQLVEVDVFHAGEAWTAERRPQVEAAVIEKLDRLCAALGGADYLEGRFTAGDLMMATVLRNLDHTSLIEARPVLRDYLARCLARPAFARALAAQLADFAAADATQP